MHQDFENARLLTTREVCERLGVSQNMVLNWIHRGQLPAFRFPSGQIRIPESEVKKILTPIYGTDVDSGSSLFGEGD